MFNYTLLLIRKRIEEIEPMSQERAEAIRQLPDEEIDLSDIPELDETFLNKPNKLEELKKFLWLL